MGAFFDFLFGRKRQAPPVTTQESLKHERSDPLLRRKSDQRSTTKTIRLVEREFDPDGNKSDLMWYGYVIWDDRGLAIPFNEISERVHFSVRIFKVAGVSYRLAALQGPAFEPGKMLMLKLEDNNQYDRNAVSIWDEAGETMIGYVPRDVNVTVRAILEITPESKAMVLSMMRKGGQKVALQVLFGPMVSNVLVKE